MHIDDEMLDTFRRQRLPRGFFERPTTVVAKALVGHLLVHETTSGPLVGRICEVEAYCAHEPACHGYSNYRRMQENGGPALGRSAVLFGRPGLSYVYLNYGIHWLFNVVTEKDGVGGAVLIRALEPVIGIDDMQVRRPTARKEIDLANGPGKLTMALAIGPQHNNCDLTVENSVLYFSAGFGPNKRLQIATSRRIGITKAMDLEWRFYHDGHPCVSR